MCELGEDDRLDIWDVTIWMDDIFRVGPNSQDVSRKTSPDQKTYTYQMCNYFSFGADCKVAYNVEQNRTDTRFCNYCYYAWCGIK